MLLPDVYHSALRMLLVVRRRQAALGIETRTLHAAVL